MGNKFAEEKKRRSSRRTGADDDKAVEWEDRRGRRRWEVVWNDDDVGARRIFCPLFNCPQPLGYCSAIYVARDSCSEWQMGGRAYMDLWADNLPCLDSGFVLLRLFLAAAE